MPWQICEGWSSVLFPSAIDRPGTRLSHSSQGLPPLRASLSLEGPRGDWLNGVVRSRAHELVIGERGELGPLDVQVSTKDEISRQCQGLRASHRSKFSGTVHLACLSNAY